MKRNLLLLSTLILLAPAPARAGAWLQDEGTAYVRLFADHLSTNERYGPAGEVVPFDNAGGGFRDTRYEELAVSLYSEIGVLPDFNLLVTATWKYLQANQPSALFETWGFGDVRVGVKRGLHRGDREVISLLTYLTLPTGYDTGEYPALGSGVTDLALKLLAGASWGGPWLSGEGGFVFRGGNFRNRVEAALQVGTGIGGRGGLRGEARGGWAVGASQAEPGFLFDPAAVDPSELELAATLSYSFLRGLAVEGEVRGTVWGENSLKGAKWSLALATSPSWRWKR